MHSIKHNSHYLSEYFLIVQIFVQLDELDENQDEKEWRETARWIKYEENVEEGVDRWGKPHVASLSFHSLLNLRKCLEEGLVILDMEEKDLPGIAYRISEELYKEDLITESDKAKIMRVLLLKHRHVHESHDRGGFRFPKKQSYTSLQVSRFSIYVYLCGMDIFLSKLTRKTFLNVT